MRWFIVFFASAVAPVVGGGCFFGGDASSSGASSAPYDPCASGALIDLDREGGRVGDTVSIVETNARVGSSAPLGSSCGTPNGRQVAFRFTPRRSGRLYLTTNSPTTTFDTVVWVQDRCVASGARDLGCNDDGQENPQTLAATMITTEAVAAGAPVFIVVAGFRGGSGTFALSVTELAPDGAEGGACRPGAVTCDGELLCGRGVCRAPVPVGGGCDPMHQCVAGASCTSSVGVCLADGAQGGRCRVGAARCDAGLVCGRAGLLGEAVCGPPMPVGSPCSAAAPTCAPGSICAFLLPSPRCAADGDMGGRCREGDVCDDGLVCSGLSVCVREVPVGASCAPSDLTRPCAGQSDCVRVGADDRCVARGARGGVCRDATPGALCDAGLACRGGRCAP